MIAILLAVAASVIVECAFGFRSLISPKVSTQACVSDLEELPDPTGGRERYLANPEALTPVSGTGRNTYADPVYLKLPLENAYINHVSVYSNTTENIPYTVLVDTWSIYGQEKYTEKDDTLIGNLGVGVTHLSDKVENLFLVLDKKDVSDLTVLQASNQFEFQWRRFLLFLALTSSICLLVFLRELLTKRLELCFLVISLTFGTALTFSHGITLNSWDEQVHYSCIYQMSYFGNVAQTEADELYYSLAVPGSDTGEELSGIASWVDAKNTETGRAPADYPYTTFFGRIGYIFQAIGMALARLFGGSFSAQIYVSNLFNLLSYSLITALAIRLCRLGKVCMFFLGLLPIQLVLATSFSYDAFVNAFLMLGYAIFTREFLSEEPLNRKWILLGLGAMVLGILPKAVYFPMIFLYAFLPKERFSGKKERWLYWLLLLGIALALAATFVLPTIMAGHGGADLYSDPRRAAADTGTQLSMLLHEPLKYLRLLFRSIFDNQAVFYLGNKVWTNFAYAGKYTGTGMYLIPLVFAFLALTEGDRSDWDAKRLRNLKIGSLILMLLSQCLVWTALYLAFNPVGAERIAGVQGRYLIPFALWMLVLFFNKKIKCSFSDLCYREIVSGIGVYILFMSIYTVYFGNQWWTVV
ncbi:MAG: DUF2142 domain-containing protein [Lachnospiraceae bacterium]|nr:DUF2142 domain-containing protein [Lachnospiraceae bacterium]